MTIYLYPHYVSLTSAARFSPQLFLFFVQQGVGLKEAPWNGDLDSLPSEPSVIRASSMMDCSLQELGQKCAELGHLCFYDDKLVLPNGDTVREGLIEAARKFIEKQKTPA